MIVPHQNVDPFNWPMPNRKDLMSLDTIKQNDLVKQKFNAEKPRTAQLNTRDIDDDIEGTKGRQLIKDLNKPFYSLKNDDIEGTKTRVNQFQTTRQPSNPLNPEYKIPTYEILQPDPLKFIRDNIDASDIDGTKPCLNKLFKPRKENIYTDIAGSKPKQKFIPQRGDMYQNLEVKDINDHWQFKSKRITNPLNPMYQLNGENNEVIQYGEIDGTKSKRLHPEQTSKQNTIDTKDILGSWADSHANLFLKRSDRKDFRQTNQIEDLEYARPSSLKKGIQTIRSINPLKPEYQLPGAREAQEEKLLEASGKKQQNSSQQIPRISSSNRIKNQALTNNFIEQPNYAQIGEKRVFQQLPPKPNQILCDHHKASENPARNGLQSANSTSNITKAQKLEKFILK